MSFPNRFTFTNSIGEKMFAEKGNEGYWFVKDEEGYERCSVTALTCKEHFQRGDWSDLKEDQPTVQAIDLFLELKEAILLYGLRYTQHFEDGAMTYAITYKNYEYRASDEAGVRKIIDLIGQLDQFA